MAIAFVQYDDKAGGSGTTVANDTALNTTSGNFLAVIITGGGSGDNAIVTGIADTAGNTYQKAVGAYQSGNTWARSEIWYAENITGNANNVTTATFTGESYFLFISVAEFSGVATSSSLLDTSSNTSTSDNTPSSGSATSENTGDLIIGGYYCGLIADITVGSGFSTLRSNLVCETEIGEYKILGAAGNYDADCSLNYSRTSIMTCAIFSIGASTGTNTQLQIGDDWKEISAAQINIGDTWKKVAGIQVNIGDSWKDVF